MKVRLLLALVGLAISLPFPTFAQQKDTVDPKIISSCRRRIRILRRHTTNTMQPPSLRFTNEAVLVTPHGTFTGRAAIEKKYEEEDFETYNGSDMVSTTERITPVGNELHLTRRFRANYQSYGSFIRIKGNASGICPRRRCLEDPQRDRRGTKKEFSTQSPTPTPSKR